MSESRRTRTPKSGARGPRVSEAHPVSASDLMSESLLGPGSGAPAPGARDGRRPPAPPHGPMAVGIVASPKSGARGPRVSEAHPVSASDLMSESLLGPGS